MKTVKVVVAALAIVGLLGLGSSASADLVAVNDLLKLYQGPGGASNGGSFWVDLKTNGYKTTGAPYDFLTFCLEKDEYFNPGAELKVAGISTASIGGGANILPAIGSDPLDPRTAWLYYSYVTGNLAAYGFNASNASHQSTLQSLIWYIEGELGTGSYTDYTGANLGAFWLSTSALMNQGKLWDVYVMNLTTPTGSLQDPASYKQDQLVYLPVPEPGTLLLLGSGLLGLGFFARKRS